MATTNVNWKDLESRGFIHVPGFLSAEDLEACRADYAATRVETGNRNYALSTATIQPSVRRRIEDVLRSVSEATNLRVDRILDGGYFATRRGIVFQWHQDHESYFVCQNHYDYLNFYIPVLKPRTDKSNLRLIPFDALERENPRAFRRVVRGGASGLAEIGSRVLVLQDQTGSTFALTDDIRRITMTPELGAGDLLLLRGDTFHKTQDDDTDRVALSIRAAYSKTRVRRKVLADGGLKKARMMANNCYAYSVLFRAFDHAKQSQMDLGELLAIRDQLYQIPDTSDRRFRHELLLQKARSGVLFSSMAAVFRETAVRVAVALYHHRQVKRAARAAQPTPRPA
jgi:hypothetical protein